MNRRDFVGASLGAAVAALATVARESFAQAQQPQSLTGPMDASAHRPVRLPPKPGAAASLTDAQVQALEKTLKCQCTCPLDVYGCRTTDFSCPVSPAMHRDVMELVTGGYSAEEIMSAFVDVYGERVRMAPKAEGFNRIGYLMPFAAMGGAAIAVALWIARRVKIERAPVAIHSDASAAPVDATPEELEELDRVLGSGDR